MKFYSFSANQKSFHVLHDVQDNNEQLNPIPEYLNIISE